MLDKKIFDHINTFKRFCPNSRVEMVTNGDPLNINRLKRLFEMAWIKFLLVLMMEKRMYLNFKA